jgi:murein DD-endopeptidase MepM/ murein hydrolase activator NlpD
VTGRRWAPLLRLVLVVVLVATGAPAGADGSGGPPRYRPPLDAPVVDPFRPPAQPWLAGNRGLEYQTVPGTPVGAIGPGLVVFAGPVAGQLHVTVLHPDGIRSSYAFLASVSVAVGDRVRTGDVVGTTGSSFHLGARVGATYIDPATLFGRVVGRASVFLVPAEGVPGRSPRAPGPPGPPGPVRPSDGPGPPGALGATVRAAWPPVAAFVGQTAMALAVTGASVGAAPTGTP